MDSKQVYQEIMKKTKVLDDLYLKNRRVDESLDRKAFLDTFLMDNPSSKKKEIQAEIKKVQREVYDLSLDLIKLGYAVDGRNYNLVVYNTDKKHIGSALYTFIVQY